MHVFGFVGSWSEWWELEVVSVLIWTSSLLTQGSSSLRSSPSDTAPASASLLVPPAFPQCTPTPPPPHLSGGDVTQSTSSEQKQEWQAIQTEEDPPHNGRLA